MIKICIKWGIVALFSMPLLFISCGDADLFNTDKWSNKIEGWEPGVSLKVVHGGFTLWDLINQGDDDVIVKEGNNLIIQYTEENIYRIGIDEVFDMPAEDIAFGLTLPLNDIPVIGIPLPEDISVGEGDGLLEPIETKIENIPSECVLRKMVASANFVFPVAEFSYYLEAEFPNIMTEAGKVLKIAGEVKANETKVWPLENIEVTLDPDQKIIFNITKIIIRKGSTLSENVLVLNFSLNDLQFRKAEGKITVDPINIDRDRFSMDVDFLDEIGGRFAFAEPELNIILRNKGIGVPMSVEATFEGQSSEGEKVILQLRPGESLKTPGNSFDYSVNDTLGLNKDNSNIVDFLSLPPTGDIFYQGRVKVNPQGEENNVIYSDGEVELDAYVRIPFTLSAEGLNYRDTLNDIDIDSKYADKIKEGVITITAINGLPLNIQIPTLVLLGEQGEHLESLSAVKGHETINASSGEEKNVLEFQLSQEQAKKLGQTKNILLEVVAFTTDNQIVTVAADARLSFDLKITAKAVISDLDDF